MKITKYFFDSYKEIGCGMDFQEYKAKVSFYGSGLRASHLSKLGISLEAVQTELEEGFIRCGQHLGFMGIETAYFLTEKGIKKMYDETVVYYSKE